MGGSGCGGSDFEPSLYKNQGSSIWREFGQRNVRANAWPYALEIIRSMLRRIGWPTFVLPVTTSPTLSLPGRAKPFQGSPANDRHLEM